MKEIISISAEHLKELKKLAEERGTSPQKELDIAINVHLMQAERERFPEMTAHMDKTFKRNRKFYELLAE